MDPLTNAKFGVVEIADGFLEPQTWEHSEEVRKRLVQDGGA